MDREKALEELTALEAKAKKLREIIDKPERKPEAGDVYIPLNGKPVMKTDVGYIWLGSGVKSKFDPDYFENDYECIGKFNEVFVRIEDVRNALSIEGESGGPSVADELLDWNNTPSELSSNATRAALKKLNIL